MILTEQLKQIEEFHKIRDAEMKWACDQLGKHFGYGALMKAAENAYRAAVRENYPGSNFVVGPCEAMTVKCGCESGRCDWCCGSGWLTKHVAKIRDQMESEGSEDV